MDMKAFDSVSGGETPSSTPTHITRSEMNKLVVAVPAALIAAYLAPNAEGIQNEHDYSRAYKGKWTAEQIQKLFSKT